MNNYALHLSSSQPVVRARRILLSTILGFAVAAALTGLASCASAPASNRSPDTEIPGIFFDNPRLFELEAREALRAASDAAIQLTKSQERFRDVPYNDPVQFCTIAYGHLLRRKPCGEQESNTYPVPLTEAQGAELLVHDMRLAEIVVSKGTRIELSEGQYGALCDFTFNVGAQNFLSSRLRTLVNSNRLDEIPAEFLRWKRAGKEVLPGLIKRRQRETALFFSDIQMPRERETSRPIKPDIDIFTGYTVHE